MSPTAAQKAAERAARAAAPTPAPAGDPDDDDRHPGPASAQLDRVRCGVDLTQRHRRGLRRWQDEAADELAVPRITQQDVLEALVVRLLTDETLSRKILADLRTRQ